MSTKRQSAPIHVAPLSRGHVSAVKAIESASQVTGVDSSPPVSTRVSSVPALDKDYVLKAKHKTMGNQMMAAGQANTTKSPRKHLEETHEEHVKELRNLRRKSNGLINKYDTGGGADDIDAEAMVEMIKSKISLLKELEKKK